MDTNKDTTKDTIKCSWKLGDPPTNSPHIHEPPRLQAKKIYDDVLDAIGNTPLIRINKVGLQHQVHCEILAKCQFMNMGGSIKDRIGRRMVLDAEKKGLLKEGSKIVEATSGNTGIGLSLAAAVRGYEIVIAMPEKMSAEKANVLKGLGARIIRTPTQASFDSPESHISISQRLRDEQGYILLDQYSSPSNPLAHYDSLAEQILYQTDGHIDAIIVGVGTGGSIAGIARKIKERSPNTLIVGVDPYGSILAIPASLNKEAPPNLVQGIGYDFIPRTCARECVDHWVKTDDLLSFKNARDLIRKEGLLVGGSSGSVLQGALQFIKLKGWQGDKDKRIVCVFSDSVRNYLTKFLSKQWCVEKKLLPYEELEEEGHIFSGITLEQLGLPEIEPISELSVAEARDLFLKGAKIIPIKSDENINHVILPRKFLELVNLKKLKSTDSATKTKTTEFAILPSTLNCAQIAKILQRYEAVLIEKRSQDNTKLLKLWVATAQDTFKLMK